MTKTEYAEYLQGEHWQSLRVAILDEDQLISCVECQIPRWLAELLYDQDLHVHHLHYRTLGNEGFEDLQVLCRRCHEVKTFGRSELKSPKRAKCGCCGESHWNYRSTYCVTCECLSYSSPDLYFKLQGRAGEEQLCDAVLRALHELINAGLI